eukprot:GFUD01036459.1.p1 GENE.GFUD01036459.1~~GFUD01036459.1.p1  ORF type:complete len:789 (+),score=200.06 GFUD01036459.1:41-2368(+)
MSNQILCSSHEEVKPNTIIKSKLKTKPKDRDTNSSLGRENLPFNDSTEKPCILICAHCMEKFQTKTQLKDHYRRFHKEFMDHNSSSQKRLVRKINRHMCGICSKHFADSWTLKHHQKTVHQSAREHVCPNCGKCFLSNKDMVRHFKGVHLGQKIIFPGGRRKFHKKSEAVIEAEVNSFTNEDGYLGRGIENFDSADTEIQSVEISCENKMVPNILKNSKGDRKVASICAPANKNGYVYGLVHKVVGIEKNTIMLSDTNLDTCEDSTNPDDEIENEEVDDEEIIVEIKEAEGKPILDQPMFQQADDQPIFQLENLENLQFVLPEGSGEPQIIIPESGIRLTIPCASESGLNSSKSEKQVLHLVPDHVENFCAGQPDSSSNLSEESHLDISPILSYIPISLDNQSSNPAELPLKIINQTSHFVAESEQQQLKPQTHFVAEAELGKVESMEYPKKFVYKKVNGSASPHLVAVKELPRKLNPSSVQQFKCDKCMKYFITKDFLSKHMALVHPELTTFINIFNENLEGLDLSNDDENLNNLDAIEGIIDVENFNEEELSNHSLLKSECEDVMLNMPDASVECKVCGIYFCNKAALIKHKKVAHKRPQSFKCEECTSEFTSKQTLKAHMQSVHEGIKKVCSFCLKPVADLARHIRSQHKNEGKREYSCDLCQTSFRTNFSLQRHKDTVHLKVKAWFCELCEKSFGEKRDMVRHKNAIHFGIKNKQSKWVCPECTIVFKLRRDYDLHKATFHANLTEEQVVKFLNSEMESKRQKFQVNSFKL